MVITIRKELIDELLKDYQNLQEILGEGGLFKQLSMAIIERCLEGEMDMHLGYKKHERQKQGSSGNAHNGHSSKTIKGEIGEVDR
jgi:putative transposase